jgi:general stress protein 26
MKNAFRESSDERFKMIGDIIEDVRVGMLTTHSDYRGLNSRPLYVQELSQEGQLWFFTTDDAVLIQDIHRDSQVNLAFAAIGKNNYLSVRGRGYEVQDHNKMAELWHPMLKAWFPYGLETPGLCLLKVQIEEAEYWSSPGSTIVKIAGVIKSLMMGERYEAGENEVIHVPAH